MDRAEDRGRAGLVSGTASTGVPISRSLRSGRTLLAAGIALIATGALTVAAPAQAGRAAAARTSTVASAAELSGQLISVTANGLAIRSQGGQNGQPSTVTQTIGTTAATRYYAVQAASTKALAVGQSVAISPMQGASTTAASVATLASGGPIAYVQQGGGFGEPGGPPPGGAPPGGGQGGPGDGQGGPDDAASPSLNLTGTIVARQSASLTVRTAQGKTETLTLTAATKAYRVVQIARGQLRAQSYVALSARLVDGRVTARDVVTAPSGTMVTIFTPGKAIL